jgi:hypothetical protein
MGNILNCSLLASDDTATFRSKYELTTIELGKGASCVVREGYELSTKTPVAVKIINKKGVVL